MLKVLEPVWYFLTKADFCLFPASNALGHLVDRPLAFLLQATGQKYRLFLPSAYLQKENELPCTASFILIKIFVHRKCRHFFGISSNISKGISFSYGIAVWFTEQVLSKVLSNCIAGLKLTFSQDMPQSLIPMNSYGATLKMQLLTLSQKIWFILESSLLHLIENCVVHKNCYGHVFERQICHGDNLSITYA